MACQDLPLADYAACFDPVIASDTSAGAPKPVLKVAVMHLKSSNSYTAPDRNPHATMLNISRFFIAALLSLAAFQASLQAFRKTQAATGPAPREVAHR